MSENNHNRGDCDTQNNDGHSSPCSSLQSHVNLESKILGDLEDIKATQAAMKEMLEAWQNTKGFVETMKSAGKLILWVVAVGAAFAAASEVFRHWLNAK